MTQWAGFPHSEIRGLTPTHGSPRLIAVCHVLHRLSVPRHPPDALLRLIAKPSRTGTSPANALAPTFSQLFGSVRHTQTNVPRTGSGLCNLFTMSNNDARQEAERIPDFCHSDPETHRRPVSLNNWWSWTGSNRRPPACKAGALPTELQPQTEKLGGPGKT
jgi:hypothetical protein